MRPLPDPDEIAETFHVLDDPAQRYGYLIELGERLVPLPAEDMVEANRVPGCVSQVWIVGEPAAGGDLRAWSDALIVRGIIAVLLSWTRAQPAGGGTAALWSYLADLDLEGHLSPNRRSGLRALVDRLSAGAA